MQLSVRKLKDQIQKFLVKVTLNLKLPENQQYKNKTKMYILMIIKLDEFHYGTVSRNF